LYISYYTVVITTTNTSLSFTALSCWRDEVTGEWRRLHNKELYVPCSSPDIIRVIKKTEMGGTCSTYGKRRCAYRVLVGKPEGR
jgi:hypothetical protein